MTCMFVVLLIINGIIMKCLHSMTCFASSSQPLLSASKAFCAQRLLVVVAFEALCFSSTHYQHSQATTERASTQAVQEEVNSIISNCHCFEDFSDYKDPITDPDIL